MARDSIQVSRHLLLVSLLVSIWITGYGTLAFSAWPPSKSEPYPCTADYGILDVTDDIVDLDDDGCNFLKGEIPLFDNTCAKLLDQGPCRDGEWLVIDDDDDKVKCKKKECPDGQVKYDDECVPLTSNPCKRSFDLIINECGEGECECPPGSLYHKEEERCYVAYSQGPCKAGYIIKMKVDDDGGYGECMKNPCPREKMAPMDKYCMPQDSTWNAKCYTIGEKKPCIDGSYLLIEPSLSEPFCLNKKPNSIVPRIVKRSTSCQMSYRNSCYRECHRRPSAFRGGSCGDDQVYVFNRRKRTPYCVETSCKRSYKR